MFIKSAITKNNLYSALIASSSKPTPALPILQRRYCLASQNTGAPVFIRRFQGLKAVKPFHRRHVPTGVAALYSAFKGQ